MSVPAHHDPAEPDPAEHRSAAPFVLLGLALFLLLARVPSYGEPLEWDMGMYSTIARELLHGERLYTDVWDMKPPAIFATFAAMQFVAGDEFRALYLLSVIAAIVTLLGVYRAASVAGRTAGLWAAAFWAAMCFDPLTGADRPNTEVFINACVAWAFALWVRADAGPGPPAPSPPRPRRARWRWVGVALLFALASTYKQVAIAPAVCMALADVAVPPARGSRRGALVRVALMAGTGLLALGAVVAYFAATGRGWLLWQTLVVYPGAYSGNIPGNVFDSAGAARTMWKFLAFASPAAVLTFVAAARGPRAAPLRAWALYAGLTVGTFVAVALPGAFLSHYFQLWFVPLSIGAGWGAAALPRVAGIRSPRLATAATWLALFVILYPQLTFLPLSPRERAQRKYGDFFLWANDAAAAADRLLEPGETFYTWSEETYVYAVARRRPPAAGVWKSHTTEGPLSAWLTRRTLADLERNPPELFWHWGTPLGPAGHPILEWSREHYVPLPGAGRKYFPTFFFVRKGGALERRLREAGRTPATRPASS